MRKGAGVVGIVFGCIFLFVALIIGSVFMIVGGFFRNEASSREEIVNELMEDGEKTKGIVVEAYDGTTIEYEDEYGDIYYKHFNVTNSDYYEGQRMVVYYMEDDPDFAAVPEIEVKFNKLFGNIFFFVGIGVLGIFGIIGLVALISGIVAVAKPKNGNEDTNISTEPVMADASMGVTYEFGKSDGPTIVNDIPVDVSITRKSDYSGIDKNLL